LAADGHGRRRLGFTGLYRSDHYTNANPPDKESLELWVSLTWLASHTSRIEFGPLVSPVSFRQPTMTARMAAAVDDLSGGRLTLGLGAGWQEREHHNYSWDLLDVPARFQRFAEGLEIITHLLQKEEPLEFQRRLLHDPRRGAASSTGARRRAADPDRRQRPEADPAPGCAICNGVERRLYSPGGSSGKECTAGRDAGARGTRTGRGAPVVDDWVLVWGG
jgi:alkanesulfonate monooxygenase SsuD/methylene tetrahydromethanopterin reductase-like flavin-dependent oxidoreductase (luciferase family)